MLNIATAISSKANLLEALKTQAEKVEFENFLRSQNFIPNEDNMRFTATFPEGKITLQFYNTILFPLNSKLKRQYENPKYFTYIHVSVYPAGQKAYSLVFNFKTVSRRSKYNQTDSLHQKNVDEILRIANEIGISNVNFNKIFGENYKLEKLTLKFWICNSIQTFQNQSWSSVILADIT